MITKSNQDGRHFRPSTTPEDIHTLGENEIFTFGSNEDGRHGKGAALTAKRKFGAREGVAEGLTGQCYALPTVGKRLQKMSPAYIRSYVDRFTDCAIFHPELTFYVTRVGCGLAGHRVETIAPMFANARRLPNVVLPAAFIQILDSPKS